VLTRPSALDAVAAVTGMRSKSKSRSGLLRPSPRKEARSLYQLATKTKHCRKVEDTKTEQRGEVATLWNAKPAVVEVALPGAVIAEQYPKRLSIFGCGWSEVRRKEVPCTWPLIASSCRRDRYTVERQPERHHPYFGQFDAKSRSEACRAPQRQP
jgi:hypothetical protein